MERGGYSVADVDAVLNQFFYALKENPDSLTSGSLRELRFIRAEGQPGYAPQSVDAWINTVAQELDRQGSGYHRPLHPRRRTPRWTKVSIHRRS